MAGSFLPFSLCMGWILWRFRRRHARVWSMVLLIALSGAAGATTQVIVNGGFETGSLSSWTAATGTLAPTVSKTQVHSGTYSALLGKTAKPEVNGDSSVYQTITIPAGSTASLSYWYYPSTTDTISYVWQEALVRNTSGTTLATVMKVASNAKAWTNVTYNLTPYAGQTIQVYFDVHGDGYSSDYVYMYLDDVSVTVTNPTPTFTLSESPTSLSVAPGAAGTSTITTAVSGGFSNAVALSASGEPSGVTVGFSPASIAAPGSGTSTMTATVASTVAAGTYPITATLVDPWEAPAASLKRTKIRAVPGANAIGPLSLTKIEKVGVPFAVAV